VSAARDPDGILDGSVRDLWSGEPRSALATATSNALFRAEIRTVRELIAWTARELLLPGNVDQLGPARLAEVRRVLEKHGLYLAGEGPA
jgi:hypothetical protein